MNNKKHNRSAIFLGYILPVFIFLAHSLRLYSSNLITDDAYIFYRYAQNWHNGYGIVWNVGEPPINGFTSWGYLFLLKIGLDLSFDTLLTGQFIGISSVVILLFYTTKLTSMLFPEGGAFQIALPALYLSLCTDLAKWSRYGMETILFAALSLLSVYYYLNDTLINRKDTWSLKSNLFFLLSVFVRLESVLFWITALFHSLFMDFNPKNDRILGLWTLKQTRQKIMGKPITLLSMVSYVPILCIFLLAQGIYFGYILPNTFYAKSAAGGAQGYAIRAGVSYIISSLGHPFSIGLWMLPLSLFTITKTSKDRALFRSFIILLTCIYLTYIIWIGGDHFSGYRFHIFILPLTVVLAFETLYASINLSPIKNTFTKMTSSIILFIIFFLFTLLTLTNCLSLIIQAYGNPEKLTRPLNLMDEYDGSNPIQRNRELIGRYFRSIGKSGETIAVVPAGAIPYYSNLSTIDMLGLNNRYLAHQPIDLDFVKNNPRGWYPGHMKGDGSYILNLKPTYIVIDANITDNPDYFPEWSIENYRPTSELWALEEFHKCYEQVTVRLSEGFFTYHKIDSNHCP